MTKRPVGWRGTTDAGELGDTGLRGRLSGRRPSPSTGPVTRAREGGDMTDMSAGDELVIANRRFRSRLFLGTGKFPSNESLRRAVVASETEIVTVALRRIDPSAEEDILDVIPETVLLLTNTSGAMDADEAVRLARLARAAGLPTWIKLEITPDPRYLLPDPVETLRAAEVLVPDGFTVLPYCPADPILCRRLEEAGCATVMPLGSWIGSNQGLRTRAALELIVEQAGVPVVGEAGIGGPAHAAE